MMDFGIFIPCHRLDDSVSERETINNALEIAQLADEAGFSVAWFPEHHLVQYIACPSPLMLAIALVAVGASDCSVVKTRTPKASLGVSAPMTLNPGCPEAVSANTAHAFDEATFCCKAV